MQSAEAFDDRKTPSLPSVPRALEILEHVAGSPSGLSLTQLTRALGIPRSTLYCLLLTLERTGYLQRTSARGRFQSGARLLELSGKALAGSGMREIATPVLRNLMQRTRLTVHLAVLDRNQITIIGQVGPPGIRLMTTLGQRMELHSTALGKAIAAWLDDGRLSEMMRERALAPHNDHTIVSPRRLADELTATRQRGYAIDDEENTIGYRCLAAPVRDVPNMPAAALSVMGTTAQICEENATQLGSELTLAAGRIRDLLAGSRESKKQNHG